MLLQPKQFCLPHRKDRRSFLLSLLASGVAAVPSTAVANLNNHQRAILAIEEIIERFFFDPAWITTSQAGSVFSELRMLARATPDPDQFRRGFGRSFQRVGLSHVALSIQRGTADELGRYFDTMQVGPDAVTLDWQQEVAYLTLTTFMGADTGPRISAAFEEIASKGATGLIIDLRNNPGGAFAMRHLVGHCISEGTDAGALLGRGWYAENTQPPDSDAIEALTPWLGTSVVSLWDHVTRHPVTRVHFLPMRPTYDGPIAILINRQTQSAAEMVAEILRSARGAMLIGELSAGAMLVQKPFDVMDQFTLFLPVADYVSHGSGRIEGAGLAPDIEVDPEDAHSAASSALDKVFSLR